MSQPAAARAGATFEDTLRNMKTKLSGIIPDFEIESKAELAFQINQLKRKLNAVILGHNYMEPALYHSVPDYAGDSLELSRVAAETDADIIVFCGVLFMAETAKVLNPEKIVLIPSNQAGCSLAAGITAADVQRLKEQYPGAPVVTYVNTYTEVKAETDYCCTSGNATAVVRYLLDQGHKQIIFLPDEYLGRNTAAELGIPFILPSEEEPATVGDTQGPVIIGWKARCEVHELFTVKDVESVRKQFPDTMVLAHPECSPEVIAQCDFVGSTRQLIEHVRKSTAPRYLLLTECSMGDNIVAENKDKEMLRLCSHRCPHMGRITLEDTLEGLQKIQYKVELPEDLIRRAKRSIDRMLAIR